MTGHEIDKTSLAGQLRRLVQAIEASGYAILPRSDQELLESVVEAAARILDAKAASIALVDEEAQELEFRVSFDQSGGHSVIGMRIPIDRGIAGHVAMTGQPIAVANVLQDARFNQDFAESTGYVPQAILAVPLLVGDRVTGVMEALDKNKASSFSLQDMELLAIFARQAAIAISQAQMHNKLGETLAEGLVRLVQDGDAGEAAELEEIVREAALDTPYDLKELAALLNDMAALGPAERQACIQVLRTFSQYSRRKKRFL